MMIEQETNQTVLYLALMVRLGDLHPQVSHLLLVTVRADDGQALVQDRHHGHQLGAHLNQAKIENSEIVTVKPIVYHLLTGHALDRWSLGQLRPLSLAEVRSKVDGPSPVVNTDLNINIIYILSVYHIICFELH